MSDFSIRVIFLHHDTSPETIRNYQSFVDFGNKITAIHDSDSPGIEGSVSVPVTGTHIPRGRKRWDSDTPILNYFIMNYDKLKETHYLFCEWDCHCRCNLEELLNNYQENDVTVPHTVTEQKEPGWFFSKFDKSIPRLGFRPSTFLLYKKEALKEACEKIAGMWDLFSVSNSEARLGCVSKLLNQKIAVFDLPISSHINYFPLKFNNPKLLYHPVKSVMTDAYFVGSKQPSAYVGTWEFGNLRGTIGTVKLLDNGHIDNYNHYNETFWRETPEGGLEFLNGDMIVTTRFGKELFGQKLIGDFLPSNEKGLGWCWVRSVNPLEYYVNLIRNAPIEELLDQKKLEELICKCGLSNDGYMLRELLPQYLQYTGYGLHIQQNPKEYTEYLLKVSELSISRYMEIGVRFSGTFIFTIEYLRRVSGPVDAIGIDLAKQIIHDEYLLLNNHCKFLYIDSTSSAFSEYVKSQRYDLVLIDGDHSYRGVSSDFNTIKTLTRFCSFHDIVNISCPAVSVFWNSVKRHSDEYWEFSYNTHLNDNYRSHFGLGLLRFGS
jgi:hypothetical protein